MGNLALLAAAGTLALFAWGWLDRLVQLLWPWYEPPAAQVAEPTASPADESVQFDDELRSLDGELDALFEETNRELSEIEGDL